MKEQRLGDVDAQPWAKAFPLGAGGKVPPEWLVNRKGWLDEKGVPIKPDWSKQTSLISKGQERERTYAEDYEKEHDILVTAEEQAIFDEDLDLAAHPKNREMKFRNQLLRVTKQGGGLFEGADDSKMVESLVH